MVVHAARAWLLNFDAEVELEDPSAHTPSRAVADRSRALVEKVRSLLGPGDVVIDPERAPLAPGLHGRAWCPTPRALRALAAAGAVVPRAPALDVLRRVNHRRFCAELGQTLPTACFAVTRAELDAALALPSPTGRWLLKRPLGFAGRGRRVLDSPLDQATSRWIDASLARGDGLQVEPLVDRAGDFALHGYLTAAGELTVGEPTTQQCDATGAWRGTTRATAGDLAAAEQSSLAAALAQAGEALFAAGYFGPFGVDAFRYRDPTGERAWNPRCEINARYSMGWAVGMGELRPDLEIA